MFVSDHATDNSGIVFDLVVEPPGWEQFDYYEFYGEPYEVNSNLSERFSNALCLFSPWLSAS